jgi:hypothetical protein
MAHTDPPRVLDVANLHSILDGTLICCCAQRGHSEVEVVQPAIGSTACIEIQMINLYRVHTGKRDVARFVARLAALAAATPEFPNTESSFCVHVVTCPNQGNKTVNCRSGICGEEKYMLTTLYRRVKFLDETDV